MTRIHCPHEQFYFSDGNLMLQVMRTCITLLLRTLTPLTQVEETIYLVHNYLFEIHARNFIPTLSKRPDYIPVLPGNISPLYILKDVKRTDFDRLLSCLYPRYAYNDIERDYILLDDVYRELMIEEARSSEEWASILELASKWEFQSLCKRAISELDSLATPIEKVILGRKYDIPELCLPAYADLCQSTVPLTEEDGERLGLHDVIKIYGIRQELWGQGARPSISSEDLLEKVRTRFPSVRPPPASPSHSEREPNPLPPQMSSIPSRSPSPPTPHWQPAPQFPARTDPSQRAKPEDSPSNKVSEETNALNLVVSPATSIEAPPATPPQMPQPARPIMFSFTAAQKPDWVAEPAPIITVATGPSAKGKYICISMSVLDLKRVKMQAQNPKRSRNNHLTPPGRVRRQRRRLRCWLQ